MKISKSDQKFLMWALAFWCLILIAILGGCASTVEESEHAPPPMLMQPPTQEYCESYLSPKDIEMLMRLQNFRSCVESLHGWQSFKP